MGRYALVAGVCAGVSLLNFWLETLIGYQATGLVYLLSVVLLALVVDRVPILVGTALTAAAWTFLFIPPRYSLHIGSFYDKMMLAMYFIIALTIGQLTARLRAERHAEQEREERATALYMLTRALAGAENQTEILSRAVRQARKAFGTDVAVLLAGAEGGGPLVAAEPSTWQMNAADAEAAAWAFANSEPAGLPGQNWPGAQGWHMPLQAGARPAGVLGLRWNDRPAPTQSQQNLLESFARQIALVLDRQRLREAELSSHRVAESERLSRTLLNSVSHEMRTPIAAINSAASSLSQSGPLNRTQESLLAEIESAAARLERVVQSLLSAARLQSGHLRPQLDWCDLSELVRMTLHHLAGALAGHPVATRLEPGLPLVKADFVLMQQALGNLLVNAAIHTPPGTPIEISARTEERTVLLEVADRGPGMDPEELEHVFEMFYRASAAQPGGLGLGLAIVKGSVEAQGGRVQARNRPGGGGLFTISLPALARPNLQEELA